MQRAGVDTHCDFCAFSESDYHCRLLALPEVLSSEVKPCRAKCPLIPVADAAAGIPDITLTKVSLTQPARSMKNAW